jgi:hypothetical protein
MKNWLWSLSSHMETTWRSSSSSLGPVSIIASYAPQPQAYRATLKYFIQHRFSSLVPLLKRQRSLTDAVLISFGSTTKSPKTLKRWQANTSQWQIMCCTVSASCLQNLQAGPPLNRPMMHRCVLTGACPVRIATTVLSWCLLNLSGSSVLFLHSPPIKSLPYLWPGKFFQARWCWFIIQVLIASLAEHLGIPRASSGPVSGMADACQPLHCQECHSALAPKQGLPHSDLQVQREHSGIQQPVLKSLSGH